MMDLSTTGQTLLNAANTMTAMRWSCRTNGGEYVGACPWWGGESTSSRYHIWPWPHQGNPRYWCRRCGQRGDILDLFAYAEGLSIGAPGVFRRVCELAEVDPTDQPHDARPKIPTHPITRQTVPASWAEFASDRRIPYWGVALWSTSGHRALDWLRQRGLADNTIRAMRLGYVATSYRDAEMRVDGTAVWVERGISIPWYGADGQLYGVNIRRSVRSVPMGEGAAKYRDNWDYYPKYLGIRGGNRPLMMTSRGSDELLVTEGELDYGIASQVLTDVDIATLGGCGQRPDSWLSYMAGYDRIWVCYDTDDAGREGSRAHWSDVDTAICIDLDFDSQEEGNDITDYVRRGHDLEALLETYRMIAAREDAACVVSTSSTHSS